MVSSCKTGHNQKIYGGRFGNIAIYKIPNKRSLEIDVMDDLSLVDLISKNFQIE